MLTRITAPSKDDKDYDILVHLGKSWQSSLIAYAIGPEFRRTFRRSILCRSSTPGRAPMLLCGSLIY
jgi:ADP-heptose:LPS heptosyltransferase